MVVPYSQPHSIRSRPLWIDLCTNYLGEEAAFPHFHSRLDPSQLWSCCSNDLWKCDSHVNAHVLLHGSLWSCLYQPDLGIPLWGHSRFSTATSQHSSLAILVIFDAGSSFSVQFHAQKQSISRIHFLRSVWDYRFHSCQVNTQRVK